MHLRELYGGHSNKTIATAKNIFCAKKILITKESLPIRIKDFFDVVIFIGIENAPFADIIICPTNDIDKCNYFYNNKKVITADDNKIYCISSSSFNKAKRAKIQLKFPNLLYNENDAGTIGLELAEIGNAEITYCTFFTKKNVIMITREQLDFYMNELHPGKYISSYKNIRCAKRKDFSQTVNWWIE